MLAKGAKIIFSVSIVVLIISFIVSFWGIPKLVNKKIQNAVSIDNSSEMWDKWIKTPMPLDFKVYLFNVTNPEAVNQGAKPALSEIGPYVYRQYREKSVLGYGENDTIKYMLKKNFVFDAERSGELSDEDEVTVINFSYLAAIVTVQSMMPSMVGIINEALEQFYEDLTDPFMRVKVKDLLFDGIFLDCSGNHSALGLVCLQIKSERPPTMRPADDGRNGFYFSFFSHLNRTESGPYEVVRGTQNLKELGHIVSYKGKKFMNNWGDPYCGMINGSDSSIFPPTLDEVPKKLYSFEPDVCRSMYAEFINTTTFSGVSANYFEITSSVLASKSAEPSNKCFCKRNWSANHDGCLLMGVLNLQPCQGAPAIASLPHFYLASEELLEYFAEGISPNKTKHNTYVYLDSVTGVVLSGLKRLQFNIELRNVKEVPQLANVRTGLFPLLWMEEGAELPSDLVQTLTSAHTTLKIVEGARWAIVLLGVIFFIIAAVLVLHGTSMGVWPRNSNSVSFILRPGEGKNVG